MPLLPSLACEIRLSPSHLVRCHRPCILRSITATSRERKPSLTNQIGKFSDQATTAITAGGLAVSPAFSKEIVLEPINLVASSSARPHRRSIHVSPCQYSHHLSELTGLPLHLKLETSSAPDGSEERGALDELLTLSETQAPSAA